MISPQAAAIDREPQITWAGLFSSPSPPTIPPKQALLHITRGTITRIAWSHVYTYIRKQFHRGVSYRIKEGALELSLYPLSPPLANPFLVISVSRYQGRNKSLSGRQCFSPIFGDFHSGNKVSKQNNDDEGVWLPWYACNSAPYNTGMSMGVEGQGLWSWNPRATRAKRRLCVWVLYEKLHRARL